MTDRRAPEMLAAEVTRKAENLKPGADKDHLLREARRLEAMAHAKEWAESPGLQPPMSA